MGTFIKIFTADAVMDLEDDIGLGGLIRTRQRVRDNAEVFTAPREVSAMLDLIGTGPVEPWTTHLEPSCGNGNFLAEIVRRKLAWIEQHGDDDPNRIAAAVVVALGSTCGIDISMRNVAEAQTRVLEVVCAHLGTPEWRALAEAVVSSNIVVGNFLKARGADGAAASRTQDRQHHLPSDPARFSEVIRFVRLLPRRYDDGHALVLMSGTLGAGTEVLDAFMVDASPTGRPKFHDIADLTDQIIGIAECDESQIHGDPDKALSVGRTGSLCSGLPDGFPDPSACHVLRTRPADASPAA